MASDKKKRKQAKSKQSPGTPGKPFVHPDGDRRRRNTGPNVEQAIRDKHARRTFDGGLPTDDPPSPG